MRHTGICAWVVATVGMGLSGPSAVAATTVAEVKAGFPCGVEAVLFVVRQPHETGRGDRFPPFGARGGAVKGSHDAALCRLDLSTGRREILLHLEDGDIGGWDVDPWDGRVVLSVRGPGADEAYHLTELWLDLGGRVEGSRRLTQESFDAMDPVLQPDGAIHFSSTRPPAGGADSEGGPWRRYRCAADGSGIELVGEVTESTADLRLPEGLALFHVRPLSPGKGAVAVAVPSMAVTREKGWLALLDPREEGADTVMVRLLGVDSARVEQVRESSAHWPVGELPLQVEHPEFCWRYPYPVGERAFLALTDREIWCVNVAGARQLLYAEEELTGELAGARPWPAVQWELASSSHQVHVCAH